MDRSQSLTAAFAAAAVAVVGAISVGPADPATAAPAAAPDVAKLAGAKLAKQKINWDKCTYQGASANVKCAMITVPQDWHNPKNGKTWRIPISYNKLNDHDDPRFKGVIMGNPGGPGGSGLAYADTFAKRMPDVTPYYNFVGFTPRGISEGSQVSCSYEVDAADTSPLAKWKAIGEQCANHPEVKTITTEQTAYDMDFIRHLLGQPKLNYLGYSYGTWLGSWYSKLFGSKADRMVLDSALDVTLPTYQHDKEFEPWAFARKNELWYKPYETRNPEAAESETRQATPPSVEASSAQQRSFLKTEATSSLPQVRKASQRMLKELGALEASLTKKSRVKTMRSGSSSVEVHTLTDMAVMIRCGDGQYTQGEAYWKAWMTRLKNELGAEDYDEPAVQCLSWKTQNKMPVADPETYPKTIVVHAELDANTVWEHGRASGVGLPNTKFIGVDNEGKHGLFPYGTEEVDRPVVDFFLKDRLPKPNITVAPGKPRGEETATYEYWKPLNNKAKHYGELVSDPWQKAGTPTVVPVPVTGAEMVREAQVQGRFEAWVLQNYGQAGLDLVQKG